MKRAIILFSLLFVVCEPAGAALITIAIEAVVDDVQDPDNYLEGRIEIGDLITGTYTYDTDTPDSSPLPGAGRYEYYAYPCGFLLNVGGLDFVTDYANTDFLIEIVNNYPDDDGYGVVSYKNLPLPDGTAVSSIAWGLRDGSATAISSAELTSISPVLSDWETNFLQFGAGPGSRDTGEPPTGFGIMAHVTSAVLIPEPTTVLLLAFGGLIFVQKGNKSKD